VKRFIEPFEHRAWIRTGFHLESEGSLIRARYESRLGGVQGGQFCSNSNPAFINLVVDPNDSICSDSDALATGDGLLEFLYRYTV
jgi:hypothetical protein